MPVHLIVYLPGRERPMMTPRFLGIPYPAELGEETSIAARHHKALGLECRASKVSVVVSRSDFYGSAC